MMGKTKTGSDPTAAPRLIVPMSLRLAIPRRVALQQSSPPLHQPSAILKEKRKFEKEKSLNGKCASSKLSQQRGSPQKPVLLVLIRSELRCDIRLLDCRAMAAGNQSAGDVVLPQNHAHGGGRFRAFNRPAR